MNRPDAIFFSVAFYAYLVAFLLYILNVALKRSNLGKIATILVGFGVIPHTIAFAIRWTSQGHVPLANMYEYMGLMSWMVAVGMLFFIRKYRNFRIGVFVSPIMVLMLVVASLLPSEINRQLMPALQSTWLAIHVTLAALGSGAFLIAFAASSLYLLTEEVQAKKNYRELQSRQWALYVLFWIGLPVAVALLLRIIGVLPTPADLIGQNEMYKLNSSAATSFAINVGGISYYWGRLAIGLGIGMVVSAVVWPMLNKRLMPAHTGEGIGARFFMVLTIALLLSGVVAGFLVGNGYIQLTGRSYLKIFEFFGPVLFFTWLLTPLMHALLLRTRGDWIRQLGLTRPVFEEISYAAVAIGYPLYTVGALFAGAIWAEQAWGTWWSWDPKEVGALIIWLFYTGFLHARYQRQWRGDRAAVLVVLGMVFIFVSFFGNYFFGGLHSFEVGG